MVTSSKDPSKMSKSELFQLYQATATENSSLTKKCGKIGKKYKRAKKALKAGQGSDEPASEEQIPRPVGETPGRGDFNLFKSLEISKEDYNAFIESIHKAMATAGIPDAALWRDVEAGPLAELLDVVREQYPWLRKYRNDWPAVAIVKQYLKNNRNKSRRKARDAATKAAAATTTDD